MHKGLPPNGAGEGPLDWLGIVTAAVYWGSTRWSAIGCGTGGGNGGWRRLLVAHMRKFMRREFDSDGFEGVNPLNRQLGDVFAPCAEAMLGILRFWEAIDLIELSEPSQLPSLASWPRADGRGKDGESDAVVGFRESAGPVPAFSPARALLTPGVASPRADFPGWTGCFFFSLHQPLPKHHRTPIFAPKLKGGDQRNT